jgi:hypothetical protein
LYRHRRRRASALSGIDISRLLFTAYVLSLDRRRIMDTNLGVSVLVKPRAAFRAVSRLDAPLLGCRLSYVPCLSRKFLMHEARVS